MKATLLIIDDDPVLVNVLKNSFNREGYEVFTSFKGQPALKQLQSRKMDVVLCDIRLPDIDGLDLLHEIHRVSPETVTIMMTAYGEVRSAVKCIKSGAFEYITKPMLPDQIRDLVKRATGMKNHRVAEVPERFITGSSSKMQKVIELTKLVAPTNMSVLIQGETGSGKEYIARLIHNNSKRKNKLFMAIDCGAIPRELASSELFGHVRGSFTGAIADKAGFFEQANGGTVFLDEIGNLTYETQIKLLRAIQNKVITRVGDSTEIKVDVRIISATNSDMLKALEELHFREDLYHRINEFKIELPPLRERGEDILLFARHFLEQANHDLKKCVEDFDNEVLNTFRGYSWPGNLREMRNVVMRSVLLAQTEFVTMDCLPPEFKSDFYMHWEAEDLSGTALNLKNVSELAEMNLLERALKEANYNKSLAAKALKIDRKTLYNKIKRYGINL
jgi:two-component system, NtrC family, response regulator HydG